MAEFAIYEKLDSLIAIANSEGHEGRECWSQELMTLRNEIAAAWNRQVEGLNTQQAQCELQANRDEWMQRAFEIQSNLNAVIEDLRAAQGARESLQQQLAAAREALRELQQACWDARAAMGFDNDGAPTPAALTYPTIPELILRDCREFRKEHDEVCNENTKLERDARAWRNRFIDERMNAYPNDCYEMQRCYAESDANEFIKAFHAATLQRDRQP